MSDDETYTWVEGYIYWVQRGLLDVWRVVRSPVDHLADKRYDQVMGHFESREKAEAVKRRMEKGQ
jgi:hypothetical protein